MQIQINSDKNVKTEERHEVHFTSLIDEALKKFKSHITRVEVYLKDENGDKPGPDDMSCVLEARMEGKQPIAVTSKADTVEQALKSAITKLKKSLDTTLGKIQNR